VTKSTVSTQESGSREKRGRGRRRWFHSPQWLADRRGADIHWALLGAAALAVFALGWWGYSQYYAGIHDAHPDEHVAHWSDDVYHALALFLPGTGPERAGLPIALDLARYLAPAVAGWAALAGLRALFRDRAQQLWIPFMSKHVVVCGLGYVGNVFVDHLRDSKRDWKQVRRDWATLRWDSAHVKATWIRTRQALKKTEVVVIEKDSTNPLIELVRKQGVPVIIGDAQHERTLRTAGVQRAARLLAVCDEDAVNSQIIAVAREMAKGRRSGTLHCLARIDNPRLCQVLRWQELNVTDDESSTLDFFNLDETGAWMLLRKFNFINDSQRPHLLVSRLEGLGEWLVRQAARSWYDTRTQDVSLYVTVVDDDAVERVDDLKARHPQLEKVCKFIAVTTRDRDLQRMPTLHAHRKAPPLTHAYIAARRDEDALEAALALRQALDRIDPAIPMVMALSRDHGVARLTGSLAEMNIDVFPTLERVCTADFVQGGSFEPFAIALHDHWRQIAGTEEEPEPTWEELDESRRQSSRAAARAMKVKLHSIRCVITPQSDWTQTDFTFDEDSEEFHKLAEQEHARWHNERLADGWHRCDVPTTREQQVEQKKQKLSPWLIDYHELPDEIAEYDHEFVRKIPTILASAGFQIQRKPPLKQDKDADAKS
jgi:TrkA family protein